MLQFIDITESSFESWFEMGQSLWPDDDHLELRRILKGLMQFPQYKNIIAISDADEPIAFAIFSIRNNYIEGSRSDRVGFVEAIYVKSEHRRQGVAKNLVDLGEAWVLSQGCTEMGSDAYITNIESRIFHQKSGFRETGELVCFIKNIG